MSEKKFTAFGEAMARISMPRNLRFRQSLPGKAHITFGGAEINALASLAMLGLPTDFVTVLPDNDITRSFIANMRSLNVGTRHIMLREGRFGVFFVETGSNQRASGVLYDRDFSSISLTPPQFYNWEEIFQQSRWFHITGITPALSKNAADSALEALKQAKKHAVTVSCDLNFRKKLWKWDASLSSKELARKVMARIMQYADIIIGNEEDADDVLNIKTGKTDVIAGRLDIEQYPQTAREIVKRYPNASKVAFTFRESVSANHNNLGAMLYDAKKDSACFAPMQNGKYAPYAITNIVDRIGGGDSFAAGLIYALSDGELSKNDGDCVAFAAAASCLCHSISGDFNYVKKEEILSLMKGNASARINR
ncbi:MAG: sugar kinase [Endomicrobium sp.]|nr:sugar kinase [Endomicrobium sp.]